MVALSSFPWALGMGGFYGDSSLRPQTPGRAQLAWRVFLTAPASAALSGHGPKLRDRFVVLFDLLSLFKLVQEE